MHLKFVNEVDRVADLYPMEKSKDIPYGWLERTREDFRSKSKDPSWKMHTHNHAARCPGIFNLLRTGWVMRTWSDITIETNGDGVSFQWRTPHDWGHPTIDYFHEQNLTKNFNDWPKGSLRHILKYNSGWRVNVPKGYYLLEMGIPYQDDSRFEILPGVFDRNYGWAAMNPFFRWNVKEGIELIPAGTPIAQYILVPKDEISHSCENYDPEKHRDVRLLDWIKQTKFVQDFAHWRKTFGD